MNSLNELVEIARRRAIEKIDVEGISLPAGYSVDGAMREAYEILKEIRGKDRKTVTECCTKASIISALTDETMGKYILLAVTQGLSFLQLKMQYDMPCSKNTYYDRYRKFFWLLNDLRP